MAYHRDVVHDVATLLDQNAKLTERVLGLSAQLEAMKAEVLRLRRWQFGRSAEVLDPTIAPPLPLQDLQINATPIEAAPITTSPVTKLVSVDTPSARRGERRMQRALPPDLPRVIRVHDVGRCECTDCGGSLKRLGEDISEQLDYVPGYFQVIRHVRPKLLCTAWRRWLRRSTRTMHRSTGRKAFIGAAASNCPAPRSLRGWARPLGCSTRSSVRSSAM